MERVTGEHGGSRKVEFINIFNFQKRNSEKLMTSAYFVEKRKLLIFADVSNFSEIFFLKSKDIFGPYLRTKFQLFCKNIP